MGKGIFHTFLLLIICSVAVAQDPSFSQFYANRLYLNPAFAGTATCPRLTLNYRNQWPGIDNSFVTYSASYDQQVEAISGGYGVLLTRDIAGEGVLSTTTASMMYSYQFRVNRKFSIRAGFQGTFVQKSIDVGNLRFGDMIDPRRGFVYQSQEQINTDNVIYPDFSFGMIGFSEKLYFGAAIHHITEPDEGFIDFAVLPRRITGHFGAVLPFGLRNEDMSWSPNVIYQSQGPASEINLGLYVTKGPIVLGAWTRFSDSYIFLVGLQQNNYKIGYSYDVTNSLLSDKTNGSHEISFSYLFPCRPKKVKFETISCPAF